MCKNLLRRDPIWIKERELTPLARALSPDVGAAHIYGGTVESFLHLSRHCANWTSMDHSVGIQARVDDECVPLTLVCCAIQQTEISVKTYVHPKLSSKLIYVFMIMSCQTCIISQLHLDGTKCKCLLLA